MVKNADLGAFLRGRRARLQPGDVGIPATAGRRVAGLRREEVATLAGVSLDYYARLEQGRDLQPSDQVLDAIARAMRMSEVERGHLHRLVRGPATVRTAQAPAASPLRQGTRLLVDGLDAPAMVIDVRGEVQAMNRLGAALLVGLEPSASGPANHTRWVFLDPAARELLVDWEAVARSTVRVLREAVGRYPRDAALLALVDELTGSSPEFAAWWPEHDVAARCHGPKQYRHPVVGPIELHAEALQLDGEDRWLYTYLPEPGSRSAQSLRLLESWAEPARPIPAGAGS